MNKKNSIASLIFGIIVLFAILLQSFHSVSHLVSLFSEKECQHKYAENKTEIGHAHHNFDHCFTCEFTFSTPLKSDLFSINFKKTEIPFSHYFFYSKKITQTFRGSLFSLRAPPCLIV